MMVPSLTLLYEYINIIDDMIVNFSRDLSVDVGVIIRGVGVKSIHSDYTENIGFGSYMLYSEDMSLGDIDNRFIPRRVRMGFLIGSEDVIHSWALPYVIDAVKIDLLKLILLGVVFFVYL